MIVSSMVGAGKLPSGIGVITPYSAQVRPIRQAPASLARPHAPSSRTRADPIQLHKLHKHRRKAPTPPANPTQTRRCG
jgi:hypothetical protein